MTHPSRRTLPALAVLGLGLLGAGPGAPALPPDRTAAELADEVEARQAPVRRLQVRYQLWYGKAEGLGDPAQPYLISSAGYEKYVAEVLSRKFVPLSEAPGVTAESALDFVTGGQYLLERVEAEPGGPPRTSQFLFDGQRGVSLQPDPNDPKGHFAELLAGPPRALLPGEGGYPRPELVTYLPVDGRRLAPALREAEKVEVVPEECDGEGAYRVTLLERRPAPSGAPNGRTTPALHRLWVAPGRNFLPVRIERLHTLGFPELQGAPYAVERPSDFREVRPGLWFPFRSLHYLIWSDKAPLLIETRVDSVALNEEAVLPARIALPAGTQVTDAVLGLTYRRGTASEAVARVLARASRRVVGLVVLAVALAALGWRALKRLPPGRPRAEDPRLGAGSPE